MKLKHLKLKPLCLALWFTPALAAAAESELPVVLVNAERDDFDARRDARSTRLVYGREELDKMNEMTVGDYLRRLPGVTFSGPPGSPRDVRVRGLDKGYTQILIDGEPVPTGTKERQLQVDRLPLDMIERIEIIRAPTADLPNEGLMGTINIVLRDAPSRRIASARALYGVTNGQTADAETRTLSGQYGNRYGDVSLLLNASIGQRGEVKTKSKDEQKFAATGARTDWKQEFEDERLKADGFDFAPRLNVNLGGGSQLILTPFVSRVDENKRKTTDKFKLTPPATGAVIAGDGKKTEIEDKEREITRLRGEWKTRLAGGGEFSLRAAVQSGTEDKEKTAREFNAAGAQTKLTLEKGSVDEKGSSAGARLKSPFGAHRLGGGIEYFDKSRKDDKQTVENGVTKAAGRGDRFDISEKRWVLFLQDEIEIAEGHFLTPGLRSQRITQSSVDGAGQSRSGKYLTNSPSLHYLWRVNHSNNLRASLTETVKPPKFDDLSSVVETKSGTATDPDKSGNPDLKPEKALGLELAWENFLPRSGGVLGANAFVRDITDKVEKRTVLEGARFVERPFNVGDARVWGVELDARARMDAIGLPELMFRANATRLYSRLENSATGQTTNVKDQPPYVYNIGFDYQLLAWDASFGGNYNFTPRFNKDPGAAPNQDFEAEQKLLDLYVYKRLDRNFGLRLTGVNLLDMKKDKDKFAIDSKGVTTVTREIEQGGRGFFLALEGKL
ncbi:MAG: TonB-dependent receptor [Betaproteobacteria bacterium]|nr:TonB-dependent receptor [Betaproteobacteria bacterium]